MQQQLIKSLFDGEVCVMPTDTVYGVVARLDDPHAVQKIYDLKKRDDQKAVGTILAASIEQIIPYVKNKNILEQAKQFWPGPVSAIVPVKEQYKYAYHDADGLAFRIPNDATLISLLKQTGPLASSSANLQGQPISQNISEAKEYFGPGVAVYIDGGVITGRSLTVLRLHEDGTIEPVRP